MPVMIDRHFKNYKLKYYIRSSAAAKKVTLNGNIIEQ